LQFWGVVVNPNLGEGEAVGGRGWHRSRVFVWRAANNTFVGHTWPRI